MATENIMMEAASKGGDRQDLHERIRVHSMAAGSVVKVDGKPNDLLERIAADDAFGLDADSLSALLDPNLYIGRCPEQVTAFLLKEVKPLLDKYADDMQLANPELTV